jgi:hypothetical protein
MGVSVDRDFPALYRDGTLPVKNPARGLGFGEKPLEISNCFRVVLG